MLACVLIAGLALTPHGEVTTNDELGTPCSGANSEGCGNDELGMLQLGSSSAQLDGLGKGGLGAAIDCVGKDIRVVTDMGFDDWGAFSVLQAAGCTPTAALATKGMMEPSDFAGDFSVLLKSWDLGTKVHMGSEACYNSKQCINTSFIEDEWGYRTNVRDHFDGALGPISSEPSVYPAADFWHCESGKKFTLLAIGPLSDVAIELSKNKAARKCIEEIVIMGSFLATTEEGEVVLGGKDESTAGALMDGINPASDPPGNTELNVVSDIRAAQFVVSLKLPVKLMPIEVASIDRVGRQLIAGEYDADEQQRLTTEQVSMLCRSGLDVTMLERMACIHSSGGDVATFDMDAIAATYLWTGTKHFEFKPSKVRVQNCGKTEVCRPPRVCRSCHKVDVASKFDAVAWMQDLRDLLEE